MSIAVSLIGRQGSGKTTIGELVAEELGCPHIEASTIVKSIYGDLPRSELPSTNERTKDEPAWLGNAIYEQMLKQKHHIYVVTGIREWQVHNTLETLGVKLKVIALVADQDVRYKRLLLQQKCSNLHQFFEHEHNEAGIGLDVLLAQNNKEFKTTDKTHPAQIASSIVELLRLEEYVGVG